MNSKKKRAVMVLAVLGVLVIVAAVSVFYMNLLNKSVANNTYEVIRELAEHDQKTIQSHVETTWDSLSYMEGQLLSYQCQTIEQVQAYMNVECANSVFSELYLIAEDGRVYTDKYVVYNSTDNSPGSRFDLLPYFENDSEHIVVRFDDKVTGAGIGKEYILYGIRLDNFETEGIQMHALAGLCSTNIIQDELVLNSFVRDGVSRGYSAVIDRNGNYLVNTDKSIYLNQSDNFFDRINRGQQTDLKSAEVAGKMQQQEIFSFYYTRKEGSRRLVYMMPFERDDIDWYFLMSVDDVVFTEQSREFFWMSIVMLGIILLVVVGLLCLVMLAERKTLSAKADAKARSEFLANMSHEIRTPLNGVIGLIQLMERDFDSEDARELVRERLTKSRTTANYLLSLVNDILDVSKLQAGKVDLVNEALSLELLIDAIWSMQRSNIESRGVEFIVKKELIAPWIIGDEVRIKQILMNIVGNAAKFTPAGGSITLTVSQRQEDAEHITTIFTCKDTGCGMSEEFLAHIWESFTQERNKISDSVKGTGLGLAISKLLADAMGGKITVDSELGKGSTFSVEIPSQLAKSIPDFARPADKPDEAGASKKDKPLKILAVEDNELNAEILIDILENEGIDVIHAENGQIAVERFCASAVNEIDAILMDMQMPVMDGCTATAKIRRLDRPDAKTVPIFACTANTFKEDRERAVESGMSDFLTKPIDIKALFRTLAEWEIHI
ncbi:MAG: response regulator [Lachnospiraceae bacterium]|nr:response regulator [Lachnospiraceae bacterium]